MVGMVATLQEGLMLQVEFEMLSAVMRMAAIGRYWDRNLVQSLGLAGLCMLCSVVDLMKVVEGNLVVVGIPAEMGDSFAEGVGCYCNLVEAGSVGVRKELRVDFVVEPLGVDNHLAVVVDLVVWVVAFHN